MKRTLLSVKLFILVVAVMLGASVTGCGTKGLLENEDGTQSDAMNEAPGQGGNGVGRYIGTTVYEGSEFYDLTQMQTLEDGQIVLLNCYSMEKLVSEDRGSTWHVETDDALSAALAEHDPADTAIAKDGTIAWIGRDERADSPGGIHSEYDYNLYIYETTSTDDVAGTDDEDGAVRRIPVELSGENSFLRRLAFDEDGTLYAYAYENGGGSIYRIDVHDGSAQRLVQVENSNEGTMACRENILMYVTGRQVFLYDLEKKCFLEDETLENFLEENFQGRMLWVGGNYHAYPFLGAGRMIYIVGEKGLYRHAIGGSAVEQVIDGAFSPLGNPSDHIVAMTANDQNEFLAMFDNGKMMQFVYDAALPSVPTDRLTVYSLNEDELVKQTIAACQAQAPNLYIQYQIGMDEDGVTREDALKKLNTQLLSGSGPDIIIMDGMNIDTYAEKGVLADLSDIVNEIDQQDGLYGNLIDSLAVDGRMYAVPAKFYIPVLYGEESYVGSVEDYVSMADMVERARNEYPDTDLLSACSATGILKRSVPVCAPVWKDGDGQLNREKIREFLEQSKQIYDAQMRGTPQADIENYRQNRILEDGTDFEDREYFMMVQSSKYLMREAPFAYGEIMDAWEYEEALSMPRMEGLENTVMKPLNGQAGNVYHPASIIGMNAAAENPHMAKQFVSVMLGADVQKVVPSGLPVNKKALPEQFAYEESALGENGEKGMAGFTMANGENFFYSIYPVNQEGIARLEQWIAQLDTPYLSDTVLESAVCTEGAAYLEGRQELDAAVAAIAERVEIYLAE